MAAVLAPLQIFLGDLHGLNTLEHQPAKLAAIEGIWETERGAELTLFGIPDEEARTTHYKIAIPKAASLTLTHELDGEIRGLNEFEGQHPPVAPVFWSFRVMVAVGMLMLLSLADEDEKDQIIASIGPFWDANETWIVLGVGVLLIGFPAAYGLVLTTLYLPATLMLMGLILRGVSFDFRAKAKTQYKTMWNRLFAAGSFIAAACQGWMLGAYVMGLESNTLSYVFSFGIALALPALYIMLGCGWLIMKAGDTLYAKAIKWARWTVFPMGIGIFLISIATPLISEVIADKWFTLPAAIGLLPIPITTLIAFTVIVWVLWHERILNAGFGWLIFVALIVICLMSALGLVYSIYPDIVINKMTIWDTASSTESLRFTFYGVALTVPMILVYTVFIYRIFSGKATKLSYE